MISRKAILCADIGDNALWMASGISAYQGQRTLTSEHMGIMGFALNAGQKIVAIIEGCCVMLFNTFN